MIIIYIIAGILGIDMLLGIIEAIIGLRRMKHGHGRKNQIAD